MSLPLDQSKVGHYDLYASRRYWLPIGANAYYLHSILHDWDDDSARKILNQIVSAIDKKYSKVLINENVVPDVGPPWTITSEDLIMMALGAVLERTEKQWHDLLRSAGLKINKIWTYAQGAESLIEAQIEDGLASDTWPTLESWGCDSPDLHSAAISW